jgi:hypothetical protein
MPLRIKKVLAKDGQMDMIVRKGIRVRVYPNQAEGIIPVIMQLLEQDSSTRYAYLCHPAVRHVSKLRGEGVSHSQGLCTC